MSARRLLATALLLSLLAACGRESAPSPAGRAAQTAEAAIPPAQPRPANLGPSIKWVPESPRYQQMRREAWRQDHDFAARADQSPQRLSRAGHYRVEVLQRPAPAVGKFQTWLVRVSTAQGEPLRGAHLGVSGGMPEHGHGLPSRPQVEPGAQPGEYRVSGIQFGMPGWWELNLYISDGRQDDSVTLNVVAG